ncbi:MAG TPA: carboxypeptidase-like regulatory domain-containing protein, partial [Candidatus Angelobacter sp.]
MMVVEERLMKFWPLGTRVRVAAFIFSFFLICSGSLVAQAPTGRLHGQITDQTGAVIPAASITVKNSSGLVLSATSDGAGAYDVKNLPAGTYTVSVTAKGFAPTKQEITIAAGQNKNADIPMEILVKEEDIQVQSDA